MSHRAIAAALARGDIGGGERLVAFALASYADQGGRAWPGTPAAAARAGLGRARYLQAREVLVRRGLVVVSEPAGGGRGRSSTVDVTFAAEGPWWEGEINAELFDAVLGYSRARGPARLLLAAMAAVADVDGIVEGLQTEQLCAAAGVADRTYRRAREVLVSSGDIELLSGVGGRGNTNRWLVCDPRSANGAPIPVAPRRMPPRAGARPLVGSVAASAARDANGLILTGVLAAKGGHDQTVSTRNGPILTGVSAEKGGQHQTVSPKTPAETPAETPAPNARAGKESQNPRTVNPPGPPEGGSLADQVIVEETFVTDRGRTRRRPRVVDLGAVRASLTRPGEVDRADWEAIRRLLFEAVGESVFEIWLAQLELIWVDRDQQLVVDASMATRSWVHARFDRLIGSCASRVGRGVRFACERERLVAIGGWPVTPASASQERMPPCAGAAAGARDRRR